MGEREEYLRHKIEEDYGTVKEFSRRANIPYTTLRSILERGVNKANVENVISICRALGLTTENLMSLNDEQSLLEKLKISYLNLTDDRKKCVNEYSERLLDEQKSIMEDAPVIYDYTDVVLNGYVAAGTGNYVDDVKETVRIPTSYLPKGSYDVMVKVNGDSMEPAFLDGDYIFIKRVDEFPNGKFAVVIVNNEAFLKKVYKEDNRLRLVSLNSKYKDMYFNEYDDIKIVGTVVM